MVVYFHKKPYFTAERRSHKKFGSMLILQVVQPLLGRKADNYEEIRECVASQKDRSSRLKIENVRLKDTLQWKVNLGENNQDLDTKRPGTKMRFWKHSMIIVGSTRNVFALAI